MKKYPLLLSYIPKTAIWAGTKLKNEMGKVSDLERLSESWELSVRQEEMARIRSGEAEGLTLAEYLKKCGYDCVSPDFCEGDRFPLLVKFIDAEDYLSVQVHPDDDYAKRVENDSGKTEMWYIVGASEDARLVYGMKDGMTREELAKAVERGRVGDAVKYVPVKKGETYFIPAGLLHAIGAGILIAEIQQNSDLTYRAYDFDRVGKDGKPRELHVKKALDVTRPYTEEEIYAKRFELGDSDGENGELLANSKYFNVRRLTVKGEDTFSVSSDSFTHLLCVSGEGTILHNSERYPVKWGDSYFLPAGLGDVTVEGEMTVLLSRI